jgi:hypothetical protein
MVIVCVSRDEAAARRYETDDLAMSRSAFSQRNRLLPACLSLALIAASPLACGESRHMTPRRSPLTAGEGGAGGTAGAKSGGKSGGKARGGSGGTSSAGQSANPGGAAGDPGDSGSAGEAARGGVSGNGGSSGASIAFCSRLPNSSALAGTVAVDFDVRIADLDCRVAGIPWLYVYTPDGTYQRVAFLNELTRFNRALWGCTSTPPTEFSLLYEQGLTVDTRPITTADVNALIEDYMLVATRNLQLSPLEATTVEAKLMELSKTVITLESDTFSRSNCAGGAGGDGGAGGESGAGGQPAAGGEAGFGGATQEAGHAGQR